MLFNPLTLRNRAVLKARLVKAAAKEHLLWLAMTAQVRWLMKNLGYANVTMATARPY